MIGANQTFGEEDCLLGSHYSTTVQSVHERAFLY